MVDESREPPGKQDQAGVGMRSMKERGTNGSGIWLSEEFRGNLWAHSPRTRCWRAMPNYIVGWNWRVSGEEASGSRGFRRAFRR